MVELKNDCLLLLINEPGEPYRGSRFDYTGQITQITFLNKHTFCTTETLAEEEIDKKGRGLYNEFGIDQPVGYDDCPVNGTFPKIGVGLLTKDSSEPYNFFKQYKVTPYFTRYEHNNSKIKFICEVPDNHPYFFRYEKQIELFNDTFTITYTLTNLGENPIITNEYVHNFLSINNRPVNNSYRLFFPLVQELHKFAQIVNPGNVAQIQQNYITWDTVPADEFFLSYNKIGENIKGEWLLINLADKVGIQETSNFNIQKINLWGAPHVVSPELFYQINVLPGQTNTWLRKYTVFTTK